MSPENSNSENYELPQNYNSPKNYNFEKRRMIDLPEDWSYELPLTPDQERADAHLDFIDAQLERLDRLWACCLTPREWGAAAGTAALLMTLGYVLCQIQTGLWDWPAPAHLWQQFVNFLKQIS